MDYILDNMFEKALLSCQETNSKKESRVFRWPMMVLLRGIFARIGKHESQHNTIVGLYSVHYDIKHINLFYTKIKVGYCCCNY